MPSSLFEFEALKQAFEALGNKSLDSGEFQDLKGFAIKSGFSPAVEYVVCLYDNA